MSVRTTGFEVKTLLLVLVVEHNDRSVDTIAADRSDANLSPALRGDDLLAYG